MKKRKMNKRGDVPVVILVIGVLAVCLLAILSFYISNKATKNNFNSIDLPEKVAIEKEKISFYNSVSLGQGEIEQILGVKSDVQGKFIQMEKDGVSVRYNLP
ncbi:MAG: hypothetical protein AABX68_00850 [Nanoarchaeota archaeon]